MEKSFIKFKTVIPKEGVLNSYINSPLTINDYSDPFVPRTKHVGVITEANETEEGYELTVGIFGKFVPEIFPDNKEILSLRMDFHYKQ